MPANDEFRLDPNVTPSIQLRTIHRLMDSVHQAVASGLRPVIEIDLDLTSFMPVYRTRRALALAGETSGIDLLAQAKKKQLLPGYSDEAWMRFVHETELELHFPQLIWKTASGGPNPDPSGPFAIFHEAYWTLDWLAEDTPTPGLGSFVERVRHAGGEVVFLSGRWLDAHIAPTHAVLKRAGIPEPAIVIGNPRHPTLVPASESLSDSQIKAIHQEAVRKIGTPIAIIDDRITNRNAVMRANASPMLSIAIAIPGFSHDPATDAEPLRLSTFEAFDTVLGDPPVRPFMVERYGPLGAGNSWRGLYEGTGVNQRPYAMPRSFFPHSLQHIPRPYAEIVAHHAPGSLTEIELLRLAITTVPAEVLAHVDQCLAEAEARAGEGLAAPYPGTDAEREKIRLVLIGSWLHSRDIEHLMQALGYAVETTGIHDLEEFVASSEIKAAVTRSHNAGASYSDWVCRWADSLPVEEPINVGCFNPSITAGMYHWLPSDERQDAMDIHRLTAHHQGDGQERYDPIEAAVNNVLHQREGHFGIRKEPIVAWGKMLELTARPSEAEDLARSSAGRQALEDAIAAGRILEPLGALIPWGLVIGADFIS